MFIASRTQCPKQSIFGDNNVYSCYFKLILVNPLPPSVGGYFFGRVYSAGKNFTGKINADAILPVKLRFYRQNKSHSYSTGKTNSALILPVELRFCR